jgi:hypothetical protein
MFEHSVLITKEEASQKIEKYLSKDYTLSWYLTDRLSVLEIPTEWANDIEVTLEIIQQRELFINHQRTLMDEAISKVRQEILS